MQREQLHQQPNSFDKIYQQCVTNAQCNIGSGKNKDEGVVWDCKHDEVFEGFGGIVCCFRQLGKNKTFQPYFTQKEFNFDWFSFKL